MKASVKYGLIVGVVALVIVVPVAAFMGLCGPFVTLVAGAVAGYLSVVFGKPDTRREGAISGSIAGLIAGAITLVGQIGAAFLALNYVQQAGVQPIFGSVPRGDLPGFENTVYYASGLFVGICFGVVGLCLSTGAGALAGHLGTRVVQPITQVDHLDSPQ